MGRKAAAPPAGARVVVPEVPPSAPADDREPDDDREPENDLLPDPGDVSQLADPAYREWVWWIYRMRAPAEMERGPGRPRQRVMVDKVSGPLDVLDVRKRFGGGVYEFWGYFDGRLRMRCTHELEGPRVNYDAPAPPAVAPANATPGVAPEVLAILSQQGETLKRLEQVISQRPAAQGMTMRDVLQLLPLIQHPPAERQDTSSLFAEMVSAFKTGVELRGTVEGQPEKNVTEVLIEKLVPAAERIVTALATRRAAQRPRATPAGPAGAAAPPRSPSEATVIEDPPGGSGHGVEENHRIMAAIDALASAIAEQDEPGEFAIMLERLLNPLEVAWITSKSTDELMGELVPVTRHPIFQTEGARVFVDAMLAELKSPTDPA